MLGIETSCDETAGSVIKGGTSDLADGDKILSNVVSSSIAFHERFGGVVPEIASRFHVQYINHVVREALDNARITLDDVNLIAVTSGPGLVGALLIGISFAKALSLVRNIPIIGVNHVEAHIYACLMENPEITPPFVGLVVSGGHTSLFLAEKRVEFKLIGSTLDDAAGEAFDKVAKILGLGYPGGPIIEKRAMEGDPKAIDFPRPCITGRLDFSFSGLKTAVLYYCRKIGKLKDSIINDICASFQEAIVDVLVKNAILACKENGLRDIVLGGGVTANLRLREKFRIVSEDAGIKVYFPSVPLCLDNAAMVAGLGYERYMLGEVSDLTLTAQPELEMQ